MSDVALVAPSDGRSYVHERLVPAIDASLERLREILEQAGHRVAVSRVVSDSDSAVACAREVAASGCDVAVLAFAGWAFPHFTAIFSAETRLPLALFSEPRAEPPGLVGMLAAGGALDQLGRKHVRLWYSLDDGELIEALDQFVRAGRAVASLRGTTFGRIGGRSMGMYTAVSNPEQLLTIFGVDVEEIDQWEIVRRSGTVADAEAAAGVAWLERACAEVRYDGDRLTRELLQRQVRMYLAMRELIDEWRLDFCGIKGQPELSTHFATPDVAEALLNDPYDWRGPKETHICTTEADTDGAVTMMLLRSLSGGDPVLFADVRHFDATHHVWDLCNSGSHPTWFAGRSADPEENLARVSLLPQIGYFPAGGAAVHHVAAPGEATFARLSRKGGSYRLQLAEGELIALDSDVAQQLITASTPEWPHAFARIDADPREILGRFGANHIHCAYGRHAKALDLAARFIGVECEWL